MKKNKKKILIIFIIIAFLLVGVFGYIIYNEKVNEKYKVNYLDQVTADMDLSKYQLVCSSKDKHFDDRDETTYYTYYFNNDGKTRKKCHIRKVYSSFGILKNQLNDCDIPIDDYHNSFKAIIDGINDDIYKDVNDDIDRKECGLYLIKKEINTKHDYNIDDYPKIKEITEPFLKELIDWKLISYVEYIIENGYKSVKAYTNEYEILTLKFSDEGELISTKLDGSYYENEVTADHANVFFAILRMKPYNFDDDEANQVHLVYLNSDLYKEEVITIRDYKITSVGKESLYKHFTILNTKYKDK